LTQVEAVEAFARAAGKEPTFVRLPRERILRAGGHPMGPKMYFGVYFDLPAITVVVNKAQRILKFKPVEFNAGLKETYRWYVRHKFPKPDYSFEDALIARRRRRLIPRRWIERPDRDYVDGEIQERNLGERPHSLT
jgi:hypothetical protein